MILRPTPPDVSVVLCTWNRAPLLGAALDALVDQQHPPAHEILVVDNASTDSTRAVVERRAQLYPQVRYLAEDRPGLSWARNTGIAAARAPVMAFTDDDVRVPPTWLRDVASAMATHRGAAYIGGPVYPRWPTGVPAWLTTRHWAPLGIQDYGDVPLWVDGRRRLCLIGANLVVRGSAFAAVGGFSTDVQRVGDGGGSTEDHEWQVRVWSAGGHGVYEPALRVEAIVLPERVGKRHHRVWHFGHGRHIARMRLGEIEASRLRIGGVPAHLLRAAARDALGWCAHRLRRRDAAAFDCETRLCYAAGFVRERWG